MSFIRFQNVTREYHVGSNVIKALNNVNLEIRQGDFTVILGPSGSGKSTFLNLLGGMDYVTRGEIYVGENNISKFTNKERTLYRRKDIGFVFQHHQLLPEFTALENVMMPIRIAGKNVKDYKEKAIQLFEDLNVADRIHYKPKMLSGGEAQRVAVIRALINSPKIIFADEPTGNLDSKNADSLHQLFFDLREKYNQTFVIITHNPILAESTDRKLTMKDGLIIG